MDITYQPWMNRLSWWGKPVGDVMNFLHKLYRFRIYANNQYFAGM